MKTLISVSLAVLFCAAIVALAGAPTTLNDFFLPGSQPGQSGNLEHPDKCDNCHGGYDLAVEPAYNWRGSMMAQAARDPLFYACLAIANQDAPESGDLCIRCHSPAGWLEGRSVPTDGSALNNNDREGVQCDFCHKLVKPTPLGVNPYPDDALYTSGTYSADQGYLATLTDIPPASANGMYVTDASNNKRGPFSDAAARHQTYYSPFHSDAGLCGTCHDVSNPAFSMDANGKYVPNAFDAIAPDFSPYAMFPIERTYSEWLMSAYNSPTGVYAPQFGGNKSNVSTCQDCHMRDVTGVGCNKKGAPTRSNLPLHDLTGGNTFIPNIIEPLFPGETNPAALAEGVQRATTMLQLATSMDLTVTPNGSGYSAAVHIVNETGHKLPSGYPEGRRMWLNIRVYDATGGLLKEYGKYDFATADLTHDTKIYEIKPGLTEGLASVVTLPAGPSFHFAVNDTVFKDNRIPPRGFTNANFTAIQSPPVAYSYADGQNWDDTQYSIPAEAAQVVATLYYQTLSKEYVTFLRDANVTNDWGQRLYDLWLNNGMSEPVVMNTAAVIVEPVVAEPPVVEFAGDPTSGVAPLTVSFTDQSSNYPESWLWEFGDGATSTAQNPTHTYDIPGVYSVTLTATNPYGSGTLTKSDYVTVVEQMYTYVADITITRQSAGGPNRVAEARVLVYDQNGAPVSGAEVIGHFNSPNTNNKTGTTGPDGIAVIVSDKTKNPPADWCYTVTNVSLAGYTYDAGLNVVTTGCESGPAARSLAAEKSEQLSDFFNYPNPFNPSTEISFSLEHSGYVRLEIYNITGQRITSLIDGYLEAGSHRVLWDGSAVASGIYFSKLVTEDGVFSRRMILLK